MLFLGQMTLVSAPLVSVIFMKLYWLTGRKILRDYDGYCKALNHITRMYKRFVRNMNLKKEVFYSLIFY